MSDELLDLAVSAARAAGALLVERFGAPRTEVRTKSSATDMVTDADRASEALITRTLRRARPDDAILGEEGGSSGGGSGLRWIVDPLDGTTNFLYGIPHWAVSIACEDSGGARAGVVYDPSRDELFAAVRGGGATLNGARIGASDVKDVARALVATGFSYDAAERGAGARVAARVLERVRDLRRFGAASLDLAWTACGRFDAYYEAHLAPWDRAAGVLLVAEAGGRLGTMPAIGPGGPGVVAAPPAIFADLEAMLLDAVASGA
jgi:myo-inositol-1(or 4)-monophosphatase